jgi:hypothetical protein
MKLLLAAAAVTLTALATLASGATATASKAVTCPVKVGFPTTGDVQWGFTISGKPAKPRHGVKTTYTHGHGTWTKGISSGKACATDTVAGGAHNLVFSAGGKAKLKGHVHQLGLLGVRLVLPVRVIASDDKACPAGRRGTITLFASYYSVHKDLVKLSFAKCAGHDLTYTTSSVPGMHVEITRHGAQVN